MALLFDQHGRHSFEIIPVLPSLSGPQNSYTVVVRQQDEVCLERQYSTWPESPDGHWFIWRLFRALQLAERLTKGKTSFNLTGRRDKRWNEPSTVHVSTGWLDLTLCSDIHDHTSPKAWTEERSLLSVYLMNEPHDSTEAASDMRRFLLRCKPAEVVKFGKNLEMECREALRLRRELKITTQADDYIDN
jgi:hypothetical protein